MKIPDDETLEINIICPKNEDLYAKRRKEDYLHGKLDRDVKVNSQITVKPPELQTMWRNTKLFVIRPKGDWHTQIRSYFSL